MTPHRTLGEPGDLTGFPAAAAPKRLVRVCRAENGTWWFSSDGSGRFDLDPPEGTCYFAADRFRGHPGGHSARPGLDRLG